MNTTNFAAGQSVSYNNAIVTIESIKGRWIKLSNGKNVGSKDISPVASKITKANPDRKNGIVNANYLSNYAKVKLADGSVVRDNGDDAAQLLRGADLDEAYKIVAKKLSVTQVSLHTQYEHLNPGQQRMCLGNRLRKALRDSDKAAA